MTVESRTDVPADLPNELKPAQVARILGFSQDWVRCNMDDGSDEAEGKSLRGHRNHNGFRVVYSSSVIEYMLANNISLSRLSRFKVEKKP